MCVRVRLRLRVHAQMRLRLMSCTRYGAHCDGRLASGDKESLMDPSTDQAVRVNVCTHAHCWAGERAREVAQLTLQALEDGAKSVMQEAQVLDLLVLCFPCMRGMSEMDHICRCLQHDRACCTGMLCMLTHCAVRVSVQ